MEISKETSIKMSIPAPDYKTANASSVDGSVIRFEAVSKTSGAGRFANVMLLHDLSWTNGNSSSVLSITSKAGATPDMLRTLADKLVDIAVILEETESCK